MKLIVDSGSTKTTWCVLMQSNDFQFKTSGINPVRDSEDVIHGIVEEANSIIRHSPFVNAQWSMFNVQSSSPVTHIFFYGAGCTPAYSPIVADAMKQVFPEAQVSVDSDMLGAARALCQHEAGIACILGTGANSCLYDGSRIVGQVSPLGWILGDEGSGAVLGRTLLSDVLKHQLPSDLCEAFLKCYDIDAATAIQHVYREPMPNRYLASLVPFIVEHRDHVAIQEMLMQQFRSFFRRNIAPYASMDKPSVMLDFPSLSKMPIHFVGGVAAQFEYELREAAKAESLTVGNVLKDPVPELVKYHA